MTTEFWLRGAVDGVPPLLMPVAHALLQSQADLHHAAGTMASADLWQRPGSAASVGFHLRHIAGSLDRLFTYARGESLDSDQIAAISEETHSGIPPATAEDLLALVDAAINAAMGSLRNMPEGELLTPRAVGRAQLPSNVLGLVFHAAEHTQRHTGQVIATSKIMRVAG
jgi:uncharacterized damage-inducible protein DinB